MSYSVEISAKHQMGKGGIIEVGTDFLEEYFDVSRTTLQQWKEKGCPQLKRGKWNLIEVIRWRGGLSPISDNPEEEEGSNDYTRKLKAEANLKERQVELADIELGKARGELLEKEEVEIMMASVIINAKNLLLGLPSKAAPQMMGLSVMSDLEEVLASASSKLIKAKSKAEVIKIIKSITNEMQEAKSFAEISEILARIVTEALEELADMEVIADERRDENIV